MMVAIDDAVTCANYIADAVRSLGGATCRVLMHRSRPWASAQFRGTRHRMLVSFDDIRAARRLAARLPRHQFTLAGGYIADAHIEPSADGRSARAYQVELLAIDER